MSETYLEIVELDSGEIVLRSADSDEKPLVTLKISDATKEYLQDKYFELAKHMLTAGIDFVYSENFMGEGEMDAEDDGLYGVPKVIH